MGAPRPAAPGLHAGRPGLVLRADPFAVINLVWLVLVLTVVAGPPATAAMLGVARDAAIG